MVNSSFDFFFCKSNLLDLFFSLSLTLTFTFTLGFGLVSFWFWFGFCLVSFWFFSGSSSVAFSVTTGCSSLSSWLAIAFLGRPPFLPFSYFLLFASICGFTSVKMHFWTGDNPVGSTPYKPYSIMASMSTNLSSPGKSLIAS